MTQSRPNFWYFFPLFWLVWLIYPVQSFAAVSHAPGEIAAFGVMLLGFVVIYVLTYRRVRHDERWAYLGWAISLLAFGLGLHYVGLNSISFLVYGGSLIGYQSRRGVMLLLSGLTFALLVVTLWLGGGEYGDYLWGVFILISAYANHANFMGQIAREKLAQVQLEKERLAADAERERIARDLHDLLGHTLSVIVLKSELAGKLAEKNPAQAAAEIREVERISREALQEVRAAVQGYRGSGFASELARAKVALDTAGVKLTMLDTLPHLPANVEASAAMLLREAITNVVRHARASEVRVGFGRSAGGYALTIHDNGIGGYAPEGTGLNSMRERLRAMGGTLERDGREGTRLVAMFPAEGERLKAEGAGPLPAPGPLG